jgi:glycosyltransferase involved in cell wall biosynthesis
MSSVRLTLILATVGRAAEVATALRSFAVQTSRDFEVVVVDQNRDARLVPYVTEAQASGVSVKHVKMQERGLAKARNLGLAQSEGDYVAFPDDDCWYEADTIERTISALNARQEIAGIVGRWVEQARGRERDCYRFSLMEWRNFRGGDAPSITLFLKRALVDELGGFDPRLGVGQWYGAGEETDLILRVLATGAEIWHEPSINVHHHFTAIPTGELSALCRAARSRGRGVGAIYVKHRINWKIIARGFVAPIVIPLLRGTTYSDWRRSVAMCVGRMEGFVAWRRDGESCQTKGVSEIAP